RRSPLWPRPARAADVHLAISAAAIVKAKSVLVPSPLHAWAAGGGVEPMDDAPLLERNLRGLAALYRLVGRCAGSVIELEGAVGSVAHTAPDYPWLNALVCEPDASFERVLKHLSKTSELDRLGVWTCGPEQVEAASAAGFSRLIARVPAMSMEL